MDHRYECYRRPYRRGDYDLVDTTRAGTYWRSPEGVVVQLASAAGALPDHEKRTSLIAPPARLARPAGA